MSEQEKQLIDLLEAKIKEYQDTIRAITAEMNIAQEYLATLKKHIVTADHAQLSRPPAIAARGHTSAKYDDMSMTAAITDILQAQPDEWLKASTIYEELIKGGYTSNSADMKRDVFVRLYRREKQGHLESKEEGGMKTYRLKKRKDE